ncbi:MAG TPA: right-handed parallel beta-helix repeat-containing protein, partial [Chloroflexota bacterium]|nr:right-handed parallel beta-helix repeat-containing protein [Chloroflexota bacterium]
MPAGDNSTFWQWPNVYEPGTTFWFATGVHTLGTSEYGQIIPKDGDSYVGAPGAILDGQGINYFAFTQQAANVTVKHLTVTRFAALHNAGVVNHDSAPGWHIVNNTIEKNAGAGAMVGSGNVLADNCLRDNGQYGFSSYRPEGITDVTVTRNEIVGNNTGDWETKQPGCGCSGGGKFWDIRRAQVTNNWVHDNHGTGLWADYNNSEFLFEGNTIEDNV